MEWDERRKVMWLDFMQILLTLDTNINILVNDRNLKNDLQKL